MIRKVSILFVFIFSFFLAHSQYSVESFYPKVEFEYEEITNITKSVLSNEIGTQDYPLPVIDFLNCNDIYGVDRLQVHTMEGDLIYRSYDPSENINLKNVPCAKYVLTIYYESGIKRSLFLQRISLSK